MLNGRPVAQFIVNAFTSTWQGGNPAAVCVLEAWPSDDVLQAIAGQNNLSETAFFLSSEVDSIKDHAIGLRWFTPTEEVDLCGHATLASAHVLYQHLGIDDQIQIRFSTRSGELCCEREGDGIIIRLPASEPVQLACWPEALASLGPVAPEAVWAAEDYLVVYSKADQVFALQPDFTGLGELDRRGVIVTALAEDPRDDFVSRFFVPKLGVNEDPVTGSAHCQLIPYWSDRLGRRWLSGWQCSKRGGRVIGKWLNDTVVLKGSAITFSVAKIQVSVSGELI